MKRVLVYDLPTRVFHWLFALFFVIAFVVSKRFDDDQPRFSHHMIAGLVLLALVVFRTVWGFAGSKYARFSTFVLNPTELVSYFRGILTGDRRRWPGHNPASSWVAVIMLSLVVALAVTGYLMTRDRAFKDLKDIHETLANIFLAAVILHIAGVIVHTLRHKDAIWKSIITGYKTDVAQPSPPIRLYPAVGVLLLAVTFGFVGYAARNFNDETRELSIIGIPLHLDKAGHADKKHKGHEKRFNNNDLDD
ncbi:MAG: cytochrome b/b6 domain-containing protein [Armatimonadetes bacterium]|nr:cytochrome b/b6 domain-containing protein [Armatimonadota bacterium]